MKKKTFLEKFEIKAKKKIPFDFILEELSEFNFSMRQMFGCHALYLGEKIILIVRDKPDHPRDNGVWLATSAEHHESLKKELTSMRSIEIFGKKPTAWQNIPSLGPKFEEEVLKVCDLVRSRDPRIGKVPAKKKKKKS